MYIRRMNMFKSQNPDVKNNAETSIEKNIFLNHLQIKTLHHQTGQASCIDTGSSHQANLSCMFDVGTAIDSVEAMKEWMQR